MPAVINPTENNATDRAVGIAAAALKSASLPKKTVLISAVSGGPDSLALAAVMARAAEQAGYQHRAVIIDHGLRSEAAFEAQHARQQLAQINVPADIISLSLTPPAAGLQTFARTHRWSALARAGRAVAEQGGSAVICLGHHQGDQAETIFMRLSRDSALAGLAGMKASRWHEGCLFLRPLLALQRSDTEALCKAAGLQPIADPSNQDRRFTRIRVRHMLADNQKLATDMLRLGAMAGQITEGLDDALRSAVAGQITWHLPYAADMAVSVFKALPPEARHRLLSLLLPEITPGRYPAAAKAIAALDAKITAHQSATLAGCHIYVKADRLWVCAEARHLPPPLTLNGQKGGQIFDNRWVITGPAGQRVASLGAKGHAQLEKQGILRQFLRHWPYPAQIRFPVPLPLDEAQITHHLKGTELQAGASLKLANDVSIRRIDRENRFLRSDPDSA